MAYLSPGTPADLADRARAGLADRLGATATVVARAPGRVNLIGEHTDYNAGAVLPVALPHATYAAAAPRTDGVVRLASAQQDRIWTGRLDETGPGQVTGWAAYAAGVVWALGPLLADSAAGTGGFDIYIDSTVPLGAGLSSSAAIECAVAVAVLHLAGVPITDEVRAATIAACIRAETEVAGAPTGGMDQTVSMLAQAECALHIDFRDETHEPVALDLPGRVLLVTDTGVSHELTDGGYGARRADCEQAAREMGVPTLRDADPADVARLTDERVRRRAHHVVTEIARVADVVAALRTRDLPAIGAAFAASHESMRDDFEISTPELDLAVDTAVQAGADAARMTGGGFGGSIVAIVPAERAEAVTTAIDAAFAGAGFSAPAHLLAEPSAGAGVVD